MLRPLSDLESLLAQLVAEHGKLLSLLEAQHAAMKKIDIPAMLDLAHQQENQRLRLLGLENRRKTIVQQIAAAAKLNEEPTLGRLIELFPPHAPALRKLQAELRGVMGKISQRTHLSSRLSAAVLGHLNTALRILAGAVERAGLYTKNGVPRVAARIGVMDAVG
ncbi:MAG: flagellar protein FlgN [Tepidisphaeraceae bacterium]|jgi:hypothetical protein